MRLTEQIQLKKTTHLSYLCHLSKNLYNLANYYVRQEYFYLGNWLRYYDLWYMLKNKEPYKKLPSQTAQQTLKLVDKNWKSFFKSLKTYKKHPEKYLGTPKPPRYKKKDGECMIVFPNQQCRIKESFLYFPKKTQLYPVKIRIKSKLQQVRIIPRGIIYQMLYPSGYCSFQDPILGLEQWGREKGLDTSHLSFYGGSAPDYFEDRRDGIEGNQRALDRFDDFDPDFDGIPMFPVFSPGKDMTINNFLTKDLRLTERVLEYNIYVNGKEIDLDFWADFMIAPEDNVLIAPYYGLREEVRDIEDKVMIQGSLTWDKQQSCLASLQPSQVEMLYEFYNRLESKYKESSSWQTNTRSPYTAHFKFLIDESIRILEDNNIITSVNYLDKVKALSRIVSTTHWEGAVTDAFNKLKRGAKFDLTEDYLISWYVGMWYEIEKAYDRNDILSTEDKNIALYELDRLFRSQYSLYDVGRPSKVYLPIKQAYEKLRKVIYEETDICPDQNKETFNSIFQFNPHWYDKHTYNRPDYVPSIAHWQSLGSNINSKLEEKSLDHLVPVVNSIINEIVDIIKFNIESPLADKPNWAKKELLEMVIDCPGIDVLKMIKTMKDLSFILFNHPNYGISAGERNNYLTDVYFMWDGIDPSTINALLYRISTLSIDDFQIIKLDDEVNDDVLKKLKEHAKNAVYEWIQKYGLINYEGVGVGYQTKELRDLQFKTFRALWKAVAYRENGFFLSYNRVFKAFDLWQGFYSRYITRPLMIGDKTIERIVGKFDNFISEISGTTWQDNVKLQAYQFAKERLVQLERAKHDAKETWLDTKTGVLSWFDQLFEPSPRDPRYSYGFTNSPIYKAWIVCMGIFELFGTDPMTGHSIPDTVFNVDEAGRYAPHHIDRDNKASLALYDLILTWNSYHPDPYEGFSESMGETHQRMLKYRLRKLFELGINKDENSVQGSNWITEEDFKAVFPDNLEFEVEFRNGDRFKGSLFYLWNDVFTESSFQDKLDGINDKIKTFRDALKDGKNPYIELLKASYPSVEDRFLEDAQTFATAFCRLGIDRLFPTTERHSAGELAYIWHIYMMKTAFNLE